MVILSIFFVKEELLVLFLKAKQGFSKKVKNKKTFFTKIAAKFLETITKTKISKNYQKTIIRQYTRSFFRVFGDVYRNLAWGNILRSCDRPKWSWDTARFEWSWDTLAPSHMSWEVVQVATVPSAVGTLH